MGPIAIVLSDVPSLRAALEHARQQSKAIVAVKLGRSQFGHRAAEDRELPEVAQQPGPVTAVLGEHQAKQFLTRLGIRSRRGDYASDESEVDALQQIRLTVASQGSGRTASWQNARNQGHRFILGLD